MINSLKDELSVTTVLQRLFEGHKIPEIEKIMQVIKKNLNGKNEEMKIRLSQNFDHLYGCQDLILQIHQIMEKTQQNVASLTELNRVFED